jgi:hypothetical protein
MQLKQVVMDCFGFPKKEAILRLNRLSMKYAMIYFFILMVILIVPLEFNLLFSSHYIVQILIYYPFMMIFFGLISLILLSGCGVLISRIFRRKLKFQLLWKMTIFSLTKPLALSLVNSFTGNITIVNVIVLLMLAYYMIRMILVFPKKKL